ncbi:MAG: glycerol-3-phosphate acyltransferase [Anaerolineae bacterium]|jgi:acyl phosphate:glycerol-3-phosphate acyltransferase|nr:glycerol-3-phosphate acyltransferase [Anaerolineae bacterium]MBT7071759.1 glycerol-3-phosphate acyltransferase [Anaerolineae bacterium]MBT7324483.1 glycerol-3-phosphate acyltransferase [Anaerolineae bacterium]
MIFYWLLGYFSGSLPFGLWITRLVKDVDIRDGGSGHVGTTNTIRQAGFAPGAAVLILDILKGFLPVYFALRAGLPVWSVAVVAGLVVIGHCYPVFANFRGGMGLASAGGAMIAVNFTAALIVLALLILLVLIIRHSARAALFTGLLAPILLYLLHFRGTELWVMAATGIVVAFRFTVDWNRQYRELWLDRENKQG